jgi:hypothetical protein
MAGPMMLTLMALRGYSAAALNQGTVFAHPTTSVA